MKQKTKKIISILLLIITLTVSVIAADIYSFSEKADFDEGAYYNTEFNRGSLTLKDDIKSPNFLWIANAADSTVSKIDTITNKEVGRFRVGTGSNDPSRTAVDQKGNVWVGNRQVGTRIHKIAAFKEDCIDGNGYSPKDGVIQTSTDSNPRSYGYDECVIFSIDTGCARTGPRSLAIDLDSNVWVGCWADKKYQKYNSETGELIAEYPLDSTPYGAAVDGDGYIWSSNRESKNIEKLDPNTGAVVKKISLNNPYGIAVDFQNNVWIGNYGSGGILVKLDAKQDYALTHYYYPGASSAGRGVAVDTEGFIWIADSSRNKVYKFNPRNEEFECEVAVGTQPIGVVMDNMGYIWATNRGDSNTKKINPDTCNVIATVQTGKGPYTYSDATGSGLYQFINSGTWTYEFENLPENSEITWTENNNKGDNIVVQIVKGASSEEITNGGHNTLFGKAKLVVTLTRNSDSQKTSPSIDDIKIGSSGEILCQDEQKEYLVYDDYQKNIDLNDIFSVEGTPGDANELIQDSGTEKLIITPLLMDFEMGVKSKVTEIFETTAYFTIKTNKGYTSESCAADFTNDESKFGTITCAANTPEYKLYNGESLDIALDKIFVISGPNPGTPNELEQQGTSGVQITSGLPTKVIATPDGINGVETVNIRILTDTGVVSDSCPIRFTTGDDFGKIECVVPPPHQRRLYFDEALDMSFNEIFVFKDSPGALTNFQEVSGTNGLDITPHLPENYMSVLPEREITTTGFFKLTTEKNIRSPSCPAAFSTNDDNFDDIYCKPITPHYVVQDNHVLTVDLNEIYTFENDVGTLNYLNVLEGGANLIITPKFQEREMDVEKDGQIPEPVTTKIKIKTNYGIRATCNAIFEDLNARCDQDKCTPCFLSEDIYSCLSTTGCLDGRVTVLNPSVKMRIATIKPALIGQKYTVPVYQTAGLTDGDFVITAVPTPPPIPDQNGIFDINGQAVAHNVKDAGVFKIELSNFEAGNRVRLCPALYRVNFELGLTPETIDADFLVSSSTAVPGYYEADDFVYSKGPYIFTAKAWLR